MGFLDGFNRGMNTRNTPEKQKTGPGKSQTEGFRSRYNTPQTSQKFGPLTSKNGVANEPPIVREHRGVVNNTRGKMGALANDVARNGKNTPRKNIQKSTINRTKNGKNTPRKNIQRATTNTIQKGRVNTPKASIQQPTLNKVKNGSVGTPDKKDVVLDIGKKDFDTVNVTFLGKKALRNPEKFHSGSVRINQKNYQQTQNIIAQILDFGEYRDSERGDNLNKNINLEYGDQMVWNRGARQLTIFNKNGKTKFQISFVIDAQSGNGGSQQNEKGIFSPSTPQGTPFQKNVPAQENTPTQKNTPSTSGVEKLGKSSLGEWLRTRRIAGKKNSCGASVGKLLQDFGIPNLPTSGRDGKNWGRILESPGVAPYFRKIPVNHPGDAPPGSVVVFGGGAQTGSSARKKYGHVEIKGSDGLYYSYYKSENPGGSSKMGKNLPKGISPQKYRQVTAFTGYAYVFQDPRSPSPAARNTSRQSTSPTRQQKPQTTRTNNFLG